MTIDHEHWSICRTNHKCATCNIGLKQIQLVWKRHEQLSKEENEEAVLLGLRPEDVLS